MRLHTDERAQLAVVQLDRDIPFDFVPQTGGVRGLLGPAVQRPHPPAARVRLMFDHLVAGLARYVVASVPGA